MNLKQAKESGNWFKREGWNLWLMSDDKTELGVLNELGSEVGLTLDDVVADDWVTTPSLNKKSEASDNKEVLKSLRDTSIILQNQIMNLEDKLTGINAGIELLLQRVLVLAERVDSIPETISILAKSIQPQDNKPKTNVTTIPYTPPTSYYSTANTAGNSTYSVTLSDSAE